MSLPDGLSEIQHALPAIMDLIADTARWVHPDVFRALPVWFPETARKQPLYRADWKTRRTNDGQPKLEGNVTAQSTLYAALGLKTTQRPTNWTTCHIWGYDDPSFAGGSAIVQDPRYFTCVANMVLLPTPLKGFTDAVPEIKRHLRVCAFHLYGWACEHELVREEAEIVRSGDIPAGYPETWPTRERKRLPPGTAAASPWVLEKAEERKRRLSTMIANPALVHFPRAQVRAVADFWRVQLPDVGLSAAA